jgi:hypothetical protein
MANVCYLVCERMMPHKVTVSKVVISSDAGISQSIAATIDANYWRLLGPARAPVRLYRSLRFRGASLCGRRSAMPTSDMISYSMIDAASCSAAYSTLYRIAAGELVDHKLPALRLRAD